MNQATLMGRLARDVELRTTPSGKSVANVSLATSKKFKNQNGELIQQTEFHNLVIWNGAEAFAKYLHKGSRVLVNGEIRTRSWEKDGIKRYQTEIFVSEFFFLDQAEKKEEKTEVVEEEQNLSEEEINDYQNIPF